MLYVVCCGVSQITPNRTRVEQFDLEQLYKVSRFHFLEAFVGTILKQSGVKLPKVWEESISKAVRKNILFDVERKKLFAYMEQNGIWHMALKGVVLKSFYPAVEMRQMSDNDILFDAGYADRIRTYMREQGYKEKSFGTSNHDIYEKPPVYNFEMHRSLYGTALHDKRWVAYYANVKTRLLKAENCEYQYYFSDEDFYIYLITHEYKHYLGSGTGFRSLLDVCFYLKEKEDSMDFAYIGRECEMLGIAEFEQQGRTLCHKLFAKEVWDEEVLKNEGVTDEKIKVLLDIQELEFLERYLYAGVYGTKEQYVKNNLQKHRKKTGKMSRFSYYCSRLFPYTEEYKAAYPFFFKCKILIPVFWIYRLFSMGLDKERRRNIVKEVHLVQREKADKSAGIDNG